MWSPLRLVPLVGAFLLLALASNAWAGSTAVTKVGTNDRLTFTAKGGEANHVTLEQGATQLRLNDSGAQVTPPATVPAGVTCTASGANAVVCTGIEEAKLDLRDLPDDAKVVGTIPTTILAGAGNDIVTGGSGPDTITSGAGTDALNGGAGSDKIDATEARGVSANGGPGNDTLVGATAVGCQGCVPFAAMDGGDDNDTLTGGTGSNFLSGGNGDDVLTGGPINDTLEGGFGADVMSGGDGADTANYVNRAEGVTVTIDGVQQDGSANDAGAGANAGKRDLVKTDVEIVHGGNGNDTLTGSSGPNGLAGGNGADTLDGMGGNDMLCGDSQVATVVVNQFGVITCQEVSAGAADVLKGGAGDDLLDGGPGADGMDGGTGIDLASYFNRTANLTITLGDGLANDGAAGEGDNITTTENLSAGAGNDVVTGSTAHNFIGGGLGSDTIDGLAGDDVLCGGRVVLPVATAAASAGVNACQPAFGLSATPDGFDSLNGNTDDDLLDGGTEPDEMNGGGGRDTATYATRTAGVIVTIDGTANDGTGTEEDNVKTDVENLVGGNGDDVLTAQTTAVVNVIDGGPGVDQLNGGPDGDTLIAGLGADTFSGGTGFDYVDYSQTQSGPINVTMDNAANDGVTGEGDNVKTDVEGLIGSFFGDTFTGSPANNTLLGLGGQDTIDAAGGNDYVDGGDSVDTLSTGFGNDRLVSRDALPENVFCGEGTDIWDMDAFDTNNLGDCETADAGPAAVRTPRVADPKSLAFRQMRREVKRLARTR